VTSEFILIIFILLFIITYSSILANFNLNKFIASSQTELDSEGSLNFSIVIAAKNEVSNLRSLISSLKSLHYPEDKFEIVIVDDESDDDTYSLVQKLCADFRNCSIVKATDKKFEGKRGALDIGIQNSNNPFILITDADCSPEKDWLKICFKKFSEGYDLILGIAPFYQTGNLVNKISCYENFRNLILSFAAVNLGVAYTASARNFGFKKEAFQKICGYKNTTDTISGDDDLLLREAVRNKLKIGTITSAGSFVYSNSKTSFKDYFLQRSRHTQTSFRYPIKQKTFLVTWHLLNIIFLLSPALIAINIIFIIPFAIKILFDITVCKVQQKKFGYKFSVIESIYLQIIYELFLIVHIIRSKTTKIKWK
jgi:cellulose synthase/poly-beta-1,6-N-acetylglucosamine synthase-like glycosyltransferase